MPDVELDFTCHGSTQTLTLSAQRLCMLEVTPSQHWCYTKDRQAYEQHKRSRSACWPTRRHLQMHAVLLTTSAAVNCAQQPAQCKFMTADCLAKDLQRALHSQGFCHVASGEGPEGMGQGLPLPEDTEGGHMPLGALMHWGLLDSALALQSSNAWLLVPFQGCEICTHGLQRPDSTVQVSKCSPSQQMQSIAAKRVGCSCSVSQCVIGT